MTRWCLTPPESIMPYGPPRPSTMPLPGIRSDRRHDEGGSIFSMEPPLGLPASAPSRYCLLLRRLATSSAASSAPLTAARAASHPAAMVSPVFTASAPVACTVVVVSLFSGCRAFCAAVSTSSAASTVAWSRMVSSGRAISSRAAVSARCSAAQLSAV